MTNPADLPPPPPPAAGYPYSPVPPAAPPARPLAERFSAESMSARGPWAFLAMLGQGIGLLLLFVGTLVVVVAGSFPADCFTTTCGTSTAQGVAYGVETARLLWTLGLFGIAAGAGIRLQFVNANALPTTSDETRIYLARRRGEFVILVVSILLLFGLLLWSTATLPAVP
ncbi:MAG: hypothetical protein WB809_03640 [Thermoplasmata archaeon]